MNNKITVTISGQEYTLVASEDAAYMEKVAQRVDAKLQEVMGKAKAPSVADVMVAALNLADEYYKEVEASENLRAQLKKYVEESTDLKMQLSEARREIFALQNKKG